MKVFLSCGSGGEPFLPVSYTHLRAHQKEEPYEEKGFEQPDEDLYTHINRLEQDVQAIIKLRFYEELSLQEISQIMEMNLNTVKSKLYRGLKTLRIAVQEVDI